MSIRANEIAIGDKGIQYYPGVGDLEIEVGDTDSYVYFYPEELVELLNFLAANGVAAEADVV